MGRVRPLITFPQAFRLPLRRRSPLMSAAAPHPCTLSLLTPTHTDDPKLLPRSRQHLRLDGVRPWVRCLALSEFVPRS